MRRAGWMAVALVIGATAPACGDGGTGLCEGVRCAPGEACDPDTGTCRSTGPTDGAPCAGDVDCGPREVCDAGSRTCRGGQDAECTAAPTHCATGFACVGGFSEGRAFCLRTCTSTESCPLQTRCWDGALDPDLAGVCYLNACGPEGRGLVQQAAYHGPCDAAGEGDGVCIGPARSDTGEALSFGLCWGTGSAAEGRDCRLEVNHGADEACEPGTWCGVPADEEVGTCYQLCRLFDGDLCGFRPDGTPTACEPRWAERGLCVPRQETPSTPGQPCTETADSALACVEGTFCLPDPEGSGTVCREACLPGGGPAADCDGLTCTTTDAFEDLGICQ